LAQAAEVNAPAPLPQSNRANISGRIEWRLTAFGFFTRIGQLSTKSFEQKRMLEIRALRKTFGSVVAADDIELSVRPGEALGIIGPNGAGKTTLFNLIAGGLKPDAGEIRLDGRDIISARPHRRCIAGIGRSFQIPRPFESLTVFENLLVGAAYGGKLSERAAAAPCAEILDRLHLLPRANTLAGALTLLERKRLEMARALATCPHLLLLDEIAGGLTEGECLELVGTIKQVHAAGVTIIWIEHIVHALLAVVGRLVVLNFGRKVAEGDPHEVMASPQVRQIYLGLSA
jgi:branched-chain amino acid transport system ATP-binding protein